MRKHEAWTSSVAFLENIFFITCALLVFVFVY